MDNKKEARTLGSITGNNTSCINTKNTKRKRITHYKLALKWSQIPKICVMERSL